MRLRSVARKRDDGYIIRRGRREFSKLFRDRGRSCLLVREQHSFAALLMAQAMEKGSVIVRRKFPLLEKILFAISRLGGEILPRS
jgi:hypothetical protein